MSANWGKHLQLSIFGESHQSAVGINIAGLPAGFRLDEAYLQAFLAARRPGREGTSQRRESDQYHILSGLYEGRLTGAPLCVIFINNDTHSGDYRQLASLMRPSHSDYPAYVRYHGANDVRGGGHFSARLTAPICFAGALVMSILNTYGIRVDAHILNIGKIQDLRFEEAKMAAYDDLYTKPYPVLDDQRLADMLETVKQAASSQDSVGGSIEAMVSGLPVGLGEPFFDSVESTLSHLLFSIPACKGVIFGDGLAMISGYGSAYNDPYQYQEGQVVTLSNHNGGILGGLTNGMPLRLTALFKPTPSIARPQSTINVKTHENARLALTGRHDPCVVLRAVPVVRAMLSIGIYDLLLERYGGEFHGFK